MKMVFADQAWDDFTYWVNHDRKIAKRIMRLIKRIEWDPFDGIGKPEPLKHDMTGFWSRRITDEHRLVYSVDARIRSSLLKPDTTTSRT